MAEGRHNRKTALERPHFSRSLRNSIPALEACRKKGTKEIFCTVWHNGAESSLVLALAGLAWYADYDYTGRYDEDSVRTCFRYSCDANYDDFLKTEQPEYPYDGDVGISRSVLYNDPLLGLWDKHISKMQTGDYYRRQASEKASSHLRSGSLRSSPLCRKTSPISACG